MIDKICRLCDRYFVDPNDTPERDCPACIEQGLKDLAVNAEILRRKEEE